MDPTPPEKARAQPSRVQRAVLVVAILGSSMAFIDGTVVNVALPAIQRDLQATAFQAQWVVESYALFLAALLLAGGALGDRLGRRRVFAIGVAIFALASVACGLAGSIQQLITARAVQGVGAALLVPGSLALISANFGEHERGQAIGTWSGFSGITAAIGPVLGGWLVDQWSWHWAFLLNVPLAAAVLWLVWRHVPESRDPSARGAPLDGWGAIWATAALGGIVYAFVEAPTQGWRAVPVLGSLLGGLVACAAFVLTEARVKAPMMPLHLFRNRNFTGANLVTLLLYSALGGSLYFFPLALIQVHGYSATAAGAALLPFVLILFAFSRPAGRLVDRFGPRGPLVVGPLVAAAAFALFALHGVGGAYWRTYLPAVVLLGIGMTITIAPLTTTVMNAVDVEHSGTASGVNNAVSRVAGVLAIAMLGLLMAWVFGQHLRHALDALALPVTLRDAMLAQESRLAGAAIPAGLDAAIAEQLHRAVGEAYIAGFRWVMGAAAALAVLGAACAWMWIDRAPRSSQRRP
jgi:EmrB/QacA subfamily drug resistance transporter